MVLVFMVLFILVNFEHVIDPLVLICGCLLKNRILLLLSYEGLKCT